MVIDRIEDDTGKAIRFAKVTRDITERREAQVRLEKVQAQLVASQKLEAVGQLSGGIAHDFNKLLMIVLGNLETAERHAVQLTGQSSLLCALAHAKRGAQRAAALTTRLLAFSRRQALDPKALDLTRFHHGHAGFFQRTLGEQIEVEVVGGTGL